MKLCIGVVGQLRTFFYEPHQTLIRLIERCKQIYSVHIVFSISGDSWDLLPYARDMFFEILNALGVTYEIITLDETHTQDIFERIRASPEFIRNKERFISDNTGAVGELGGVDNIEKKMREWLHQMVHVRNVIRTAPGHDVYMKVRFDCILDDSVLPVCPTDTLEEVLLPFACVREYYTSRVDVTSDAFLKRLHYTKIVPPCFRVDEWDDCTIGGGTVVNATSLEAIRNGERKILYCLNDFVFYGRADAFCSLESLCEWYGREPGIEDSPFIFAPESQLILFCTNRGIATIMYPKNVGARLLRY
jgi:hypothetical protein